MPTHLKKLAKLRKSNGDQRKQEIARFNENKMMESEVRRSWTQEEMKKGAKEESQLPLNVNSSAECQLWRRSHYLTLKRQRRGENEESRLQLSARSSAERSEPTAERCTYGPEPKFCYFSRRYLLAERDVRTLSTLLGGDFWMRKLQSTKSRLVKCCYGDRGNSRFILGVSKEVCGRGSSLVCLRSCSSLVCLKRWFILGVSKEVFILREVFEGGVSSFVKIQRRCSLISCGFKRGELALIVIQMEGSYQTFAEGASINRPPLFTGENYAFWKSIDIDIWEAVVHGPFVPTNNMQEPNLVICGPLKIREEHNTMISLCKTAQEMWEVLRVTHEDIDEFKYAQNNSLIMEENDSSSSSSTTSSMSVSDEEANICLVANDDAGNQISTSSDSENYSQYSESELHESYPALILVKLASVELVKCFYGDGGNSRFILGVSKEVCGRGSSLVCLRRCSSLVCLKRWFILGVSKEVFILREVFKGGVSLFVKIQRRCSLISCGFKRGVRVGDSAISMDESGSASSPLRPVTVDGADVDAALSKSRFLTREEVLRRRLRRVKQLGRCYRAHYWALMEELRSKYRDYSWTYGKSPFKEGHNETEIDYQNGGGVPALGGGDDIVRCRFSGCKTKAMALTTYCHSHILSDSKQRLYHGCRAVAKK
ncbi:hypothetical protein V8G54_011113 [Vigna mungo]|uniref:KANL2-like probable zinc-finger domain-containing protein n=1 Tax=Vigna mungo TaxID=3915 RepID=A0AAQ3S0W4_VIGMU